jgi:hypothetical protein
VSPTGDTGDAAVARVGKSSWTKRGRLLAVLLAAGAGVAAGWIGRGRRLAPRGETTATEDRNHDGRPDRWVERDALGRTSRVRDDGNHDGFPERTEVYVDGRLNRIDYDSDGDRRYDSTDQVSPAGVVVMTMTDRNWNTLPERWVQYNARRRVASEWIDENEDSTPERYRSYDVAGRLAEEGVDADGDGLYEVNRTFNTRWPHEAGPLRVDRDDDRDGIFERRETYGRDGRLRTVNDDSDGDSVRDRLAVYRPDGTVRKEGRDRDGDGFYEEWRFPQTGGPARLGRDDDHDYDIDRWDAPGPPAGWCEARCGGDAPRRPVR